MARARVKAELIRWVREDAGLTIAEVAKKTGTSEARVVQWENGELAPTIRQLRLLGNAAKRPLAVFYLADPPKRFQAMRDFRRIPGDPLEEGSSELRLAIRFALARREIALELAQGLDERRDELSLQATVDEDPRDVGQRIREFLGVRLEVQKKWSGAYEALNSWKDAIEDKGVLVFQAPGVGVAEMRGFSVAEMPLPMIVLNVRDAPNGRVFSLMHEFTHLLLRQGGLCDLSDRGARPPEDDRIEVFCNAVAAETLVPGAALLLSTVVQHHGASEEWSEEDLARLAREFSVSREVVLRRLLESGRTTTAFYRRMRAQFLEEYEARRSSRTGFAPPDVAAVSHAGNSFVRLVLDAYYSERITSRDVSEYLGVRLKHLPKIEERMKVHPGVRSGLTSRTSAKPWGYRRFG